MFKFYFSLVLLYYAALALGQYEGIERFAAAQNLEYPIKAYNIPAVYYSADAPELPYKLDNSELKYFSPIVYQDLPSCGQIAGETYAFGYEINRLRNLSAHLPENQYPDLFTYFFSTYWGGVNYLDSWEVLKYLGIPSVKDYYGNCVDTFDWMNGYEYYYNAMKNRIEDYYSMPVRTLDDIRIIRHWLHDHLDGSMEGGVCCFYANPSWYVDFIGPDSEETGKYIIHYYSPDYTHALTIVGYNDSIKYDKNQDGLFTCDMDINGDNIVDLRDCEIGAFKIANSYGEEWRNDGYCYMTYASAAYIWEQKVHVLKVREHYEPSLTMKIRMKHQNRSAVKIIAGISNDCNDTIPEFTIEFPVFNNQGGNYPFTYCTEEFEFGIDISSLRDFVKSDQVKIFLNVKDAESADNTNGRLLYYSVIDYTTGNEYVGVDSDSKILINRDNYYPVILNVNCSGNSNLELVTDENLKLKAGINHYQLQATGGVPPYSWFIPQDIKPDVIGERFVQYEMPDSMPVSFYSYRGNLYKSVSLNFDFPYHNSLIDSVRICDNGWVDLYDRSAEKKYYYPYQRTIDTCYNKIQVLGGLDLIRRSFSDSMYYKLTDRELFIHWKLHVFDSLEIVDTVDVALKIDSGGEIDIFYKYVNTEKEWKCGFYYKTNPKYDLKSKIEELGMYSKFSFSFSQNMKIAVNESGILTINSDSLGLFEKVMVAVQDSVKTTHYKEFRVMSDVVEVNTSRVYPNPFYANTNIIFTLQEESMVTLEIYDLNGKLIASPVNNELLRGHQIVKWTPERDREGGLPGGVYIYKLTINQHTEAKRMIQLN